MTSVETAKPCPSKEKKQPKLQILLAALAIGGRIHRVCMLVDTLYDWSKNHLTSVWEWMKNLGDFL